MDWEAYPQNLLEHSDLDADDQHQDPYVAALQQGRANWFEQHWRHIQSNLGKGGNRALIGMESYRDDSEEAEKHEEGEPRACPEL
jgi:hypothetical protein